MNSSTSYVEEAHKVILSLKGGENGRIKLTTSQLRKFLSMLNAIHEKTQALSASGNNEDDRLRREIIDELQVLKVRLIYQCGRDQYVRQFAEKAGLIKKIDDIRGSKKAFEDFFRYVEALVAYHKFEGGSD